MVTHNPVIICIIPRAFSKGDCVWRPSTVGANAAASERTKAASSGSRSRWGVGWHRDRVCSFIRRCRAGSGIVPHPPHQPLSSPLPDGVGNRRDLKPLCGSPLAGSCERTNSADICWGPGTSFVRSHRADWSGPLPPRRSRHPLAEPLPRGMLVSSARDCVGAAAWAGASGGVAGRLGALGGDPSNTSLQRTRLTAGR
jgi:hypothetical protein